MNMREEFEKREEQELDPLAMLSKDVVRDYPMEACEFRTNFQRDRDRIIHSKAFRRLMHKTQVFIAPECDHYRTRLTHTHEVAQISRTIARALRLNEDLAEAIALGHDLGHTPFGHAGEEALDTVSPVGFKHNEQSWRVAKYLEKFENYEHPGLNLTHETLDGILNHTGDTVPYTLEGQIVKIADRVAYINHDIEDAARAGIIKPDELPKDCEKVLGKTKSERINTMITDLIRTSRKNMDEMLAKGMGRPNPDIREEIICMSPAIKEATLKLREFMFQKVYIDSPAKAFDKKAKTIVVKLYQHYSQHPEELPEEMQQSMKRQGVQRVAADYVAGMTDKYALRMHDKVFSLKGWGENCVGRNNNGRNVNNDFIR